MHVKAEYYHTDLIGWGKSLQFYADIFHVYEKRLAEVVSKNTGKEVRAGVERFQNQFILQREQFDILRHEVNEQEKKIKAGIQSAKAKGAEDKSLTDRQAALKDKMKQAEHIFDETRRSFYRFLSEVF